MAYYYKNIIITDTAERCIRQHNITYDEVFLTFHHPHKTEKTRFGNYKGIRDFKSYKVAVSYRWDGYKKVWVIISCWTWVITTKTRWHGIRWNLAHILG